jgi:hypothetical protein
MKTSRVIPIVLIALLGCKGAEKPAPTEPESRRSELGRGWKKVDAGAAFSFSLPEEMEQQRATGTDSLVGEYRSARMRVTFDYGPYSNPVSNYSGKSGCDEDTDSISGKEATIVECRKPKANSVYGHVAAIHFSEVHKMGEGADTMKLTMEIEYNEDDDLETARKVFQSIVFK